MYNNDHNPKFNHNEIITTGKCSTYLVRRRHNSQECIFYFQCWIPLIHFLCWKLFIKIIRHRCNFHLCFLNFEKLFLNFCVHNKRRSVGGQKFCQNRKLLLLTSNMKICLWLVDQQILNKYSNLFDNHDMIYSLLEEGSSIKSMATRHKQYWYGHMLHYFV